MGSLRQFNASHRVNFAERNRQPELAEVAPIKNDLYMQSWIGPNDEIMMHDPLLQLSGTDSFKDYLPTYREMLIKWPHARHCLQKRKNAVLARPITITASSDDQRDVEIAEFVKTAIKGITNFKGDLKELLDAIWYGFSVDEIMWAYKGGQIVPVKLLNREQERFRYKVSGELMLDSTGMRSAFEIAPPDKFVVHSYNTEYEIPYGWGEARYAYWYYFFHKNALKFWALFTEKFAAPTAVGQYPPGVSKAEQDALMNTLKAIQNQQCLRIPENMKIELLEAQRTGSLDCYQSFVRYLELSVSKAILGGTLTSDEGQFGTRAQADVHEDARYEFTESDCESISGTIRDQLIDPMVRFNFGNDAGVPECSFSEEDNYDLESQARTDQMLVNMGVPLSKKYFYEFYKRPAPEDGDELVQGSGGAETRTDTDLHGLTRNFGEDGAVKRDQALAKRWREDEDKFIEAASRKGGRFYFKLMNEIRGMFEKMEDESGVWAIRGEMFDVDTAPLANYLAWALFTARLNGMAEIQKLQIENSKLQIENFGEADEGYVFEPLEPVEAIEWFKGRVPMTKEEFEQLLWGARQQAFTVADIQSRDVIGKVQDSLTKALSDGQSFAEWKKGIRDVFEREGVTEKSDFRMRTIFQTNVHNALIEGRDQRVEGLAQAGLVKLGRWVGVGDSRERPEHRALNNQVFAWDDVSVWRKLKDYNCRCMKMPVFNL